MSLSVYDLHSGYGALEILHGVSLRVEAGTIATLIGANGAGKTTLLMTICGRPRAWAGNVTFEDTDVTDTETHNLVKRGIAIVPEGRRIFPRMTVLENLQMGAYADSTHLDEDLASIFVLFPQLKDRLRQRGGTLSGGEQQMLALARALVSRPRLLLLDEPSLGLAPKVVEQLFRAIRTINEERKTTILLVEQNVFQALAIAEYGYVLAGGRITLSGTASELRSNPNVQRAYLGGSIGQGSD